MAVTSQNVSHTRISARPPPPSCTACPPLSRVPSFPIYTQQAKALGHMTMGVALMQMKRQREAEREFSAALSLWSMWRTARQEGGAAAAADVVNAWVMAQEGRTFKCMQECLVAQHRCAHWTHHPVLRRQPLPILYNVFHLNRGDGAPPPPFSLI